jgi:hypothetical protein
MIGACVSALVMVPWILLPRCAQAARGVSREAATARAIDAISDRRRADVDFMQDS